MSQPSAEDRADSAAFLRMAGAMTGQGLSFRFVARGRSMIPAILDGEVLQVQPVSAAELRRGDIVLLQNHGELKAHRIVGRKGELFVTRGDSSMDVDEAVSQDKIMGRVTSKCSARTGQEISVSSVAARIRFFLAEARRRVSGRPFFMLAFSWLLFSGTLRAQIVVSGTPATGSAQVTGTGAVTFATISNYVVPVGTNRLMIVGVSISTQGNNVNSSVTSITYGTQSLTKIGGTVLETAARRVEMWQLLAPTAGTATITVNGNKTGSNNNKLGVVAGVITFTGVDQSSPLRSSTSASGSSAAASASLSSSGADFVLDTLCVAGTITVTNGTGQTSRWNVQSGNTGQDAAGVASSESGTSPTATITENLSGSTAWTLGAISIRASGADFSITKVGSPEPVLQNATLTYTLTITNNGLQNAVGVLVLDTLPTQVSYVSSSASQGSCTQASGVVSCTLGAMANGATATVTIVTTAVTPSSADNTAVVSPVGVVDPDLTNNTSVFTSTIEYPTAVGMNSFTAEQGQHGALLSWNTGGEVHNLGFNVYRDEGGQKVKLNSSLIAGSALLMRDTMAQHASKTYRWVDASPKAGGLYWLEDVDLNGTRTLHGPVSADANGTDTAAMEMRSAMVQDLASASSVAPSADVAMNAGAGPVARVREATDRPGTRAMRVETSFRLAAAPAVKIFVDHEGWYRVSQPQLMAAGLSSHVNSRELHLYAEGVEQPMRIIGGEQFGPQSAIEFYGTAIDTPYSGRRVYWLTEDSGRGLRISDAPVAGSANGQAQTFMQTLELKPRTTYFGTLLRENIDEFFGPLVSSVPESETLNVANMASGEGKISVALQGVTDGQQHTVTVMLNGSTLGDMNFVNQEKGRQEFQVPSGVLNNGANTIALVAQQGDNDYSLVDTIDVSFPHTLTAESDLLKFTANSGESVTVGGFARRPSRLIDVTNPLHPYQVRYEVKAEAGRYALTATIPWTVSGPHSLLALSDAQLATPVAMAPHHATNLHSEQEGAEYLVLTAPQFAGQMQPLVNLRRSEGKKIAVVPVDEVYDEFNFGERTPFAIRNFLKTASEGWKQKPHYLLLVGDASVDPRDYLGLGSFDLVPTKIVSTAELMTASDDWFSDFENTGMAKIATGRLPARTEDDARTMIGKIVSYAKGAPSDWNSRALMVADKDDPTIKFSQQSQTVQKLLPSSMSATDVFAGALGTSTARQNLLDGINSGQLLVNYNGHGSVEVWSNGSLFNNTLAASLSNEEKMPLFVMMNCLNGFFHDVFTQSMAETLMLAPHGGAVAVWASSGLTSPAPQFVMNQTLTRGLFANSTISVGDAVMAAKSSITDEDVRKTFVLFGDPAMQLRVPATASATETPGHAGMPSPARAPRTIERATNRDRSRLSK